MPCSPGVQRSTPETQPQCRAAARCPCSTSVAHRLPELPAHALTWRLRHVPPPTTAVLTVNSALDNTTAGDGLVTLREAIIAANTDTTTDLGQTGAGHDEIRFAQSLNGATIQLSSIGELEITSAWTSKRAHFPAG